MGVKSRASSWIGNNTIPQDGMGWENSKMSTDGKTQLQVSGAKSILLVSE